MRPQLLLFSIFSLFLLSCTQTYIVTFQGGLGGSVSNAGGEYDEGSMVTVTAQPVTGYEFQSWSDGYTQNPRTITVTESLSLSAQFSKQQYEITLITEGEGSIQSSGGSGQGVFEYGSMVSFQAVPAAGWEFVEWIGDIESTDNPVNYTISTNNNIIAVFEYVGYSISRHTISIPLEDFPSQNHLEATVSNISGGFNYKTTNGIFYFRGGQTADETAGGIEEVDPSPSVVLQKKDGVWDLFKVDKNIFTCGVRTYAINDNIITIGDGNELGPNQGADRWKGDVWQGIVDDFGDILWTRVTTNESRSYNHGIAAGDLNGDGFIDISSGPGYRDPDTGDRLGQSVWLNNGDGTFEWNLDLIPKDAPAPFGLAFADIIGDSREEIILGGNSEGYGSSNFIHFYRYNDDTDNFQLFKKLEDNTLWDYGMFTTKVDTFDFNNDGNLDIIQYQADKSGEGFDIWLGDNSGGFFPYFSKAFEASTLSSSEFEVFDVNNDGFLDVILRPNGYFSSFRVNPSERNYEITNGIILNNVIWLNDGDGRFNAYDQNDLTFDKEIEGKTFHPLYAVPFMENGELHFLCVAEDFELVVNSKVEFTVFDITVFFE